MNNKLFKKPIETPGGFDDLICELAQQGRLFHCDDSAFDIINIETSARTFTDEEAEDLNQRMEEAYNLEWPDNEDPCSVLLKYLRKQAINL